VAIHRFECHVATIELHRATFGRDHPNRHAEGRCLARTIPTKKPDHFTSVYLKRDTVDDASS
jgi:hypothetical protein